MSSIKHSPGSMTQVKFFFDEFINNFFRSRENGSNSAGANECCLPVKEECLQEVKQFKPAQWLNKGTSLKSSAK